MIILRQKEFVSGKFKGTTTPRATKMGSTGDVYIINPSDPRHEEARKRIRNGEDRDKVLNETYGPGASEDQTLIAESHKHHKDSDK